MYELPLAKAKPFSSLCTVAPQVPCRTFQVDLGALVEVTWNAWDRTVGTASRHCDCFAGGQGFPQGGPSMMVIAG